MLHGHEIFVVDDDETVHDVFLALLEPEGCRVACFAEGHAFLAAARQRIPACILLDVNMPDCSGIDLLRELDAPNYPSPILIVSGQSDVPTAVHAIKNGAHDFIEKPFDPVVVLEQVRETVAAAVRRRQNVPGVIGHFQGYELLTPREREVLAQILSGASNKETGRTLGISPRTVEVHRARIMDKLLARNAADLVRIVLRREAS